MQIGNEMLLEIWLLVELLYAISLTVWLIEVI